MKTEVILSSGNREGRVSMDGSEAASRAQK